MALRDLVEDLAPRPATRWIGGVQGPAALEFGTLALGKLDIALRQTIPEVLGKLDLKMTAAFHAVHNLAAKSKLSMRDAAYVIAISRVAQACKDRGWV